MRSQMLDHMIIFHDNACPHIAILVITVFQEYDWEVLSHSHTVLIRVPQTTTISKIQGMLSGICFSDLSEPSSAMTREIRRLSKIQFLHGIERLLECWLVCFSCEGDCIERL